MEYQRMDFLWCDCMIVYLCHRYIYVYFVSSPYLLLFGNDRIRGTREQIMLQVDLVRHRTGAGLDWDKEFSKSFIVL